jgi:hypothetical protein
LTVVSATSSPPFQPVRHQRNVCHPFVDRFTQQTLPTVNRKLFFTDILCVESFCPQKTHNARILFGSTPLKYGHHFDYGNQPLNMRMRVCYLDCYEAGLCCYLVIHIENLSRPLQLCYFHLWPILLTFPRITYYHQLLLATKNRRPYVEIMSVRLCPSIRAIIIGRILFNFARTYCVILILSHIFHNKVQFT